jgi:riboflavin biosynthesis pyrimidine reductase
MRSLYERGEPRSRLLSNADLATFYQPLISPCLRVNMVASLDGAAAGATGVTNAINTPPDRQLFGVLRGLADAIVVGAGTARAENYGPARCPLVVVTRSGQLPPRLQDAPAEQVLVRSPKPDLAALIADLHGAGLTQLLCEGGPSLLADLLAANLVDELCLTTTPFAVGGNAGRIVAGPDLFQTFKLESVVEGDQTLLTRWVRDPSGQ